MRYRPEIDGLRAVAVLPVLFFHAGFSLFSGGYVGVDVFFVISGYLITSIILPDIYAGTFSLKNFYERRARRILPALFLVVSASIPFAWLWLTPLELKGFSESVVAVSLFISNFLFGANSGYFERQSELEPLLHTWSLAVEEQFYILFPLLLMALIGWKFKPNRVFATLLALGLLSLLFAEMLTNKHPYVSFFLSPTRAWELLLGSLIAVYLYAHKELSVARIWREVLSFTGLMMIVYSMVSYSDQTPFPSIYTLVPTVGAFLIIAFATENTFTQKLLSAKALVGIGLMSYSLYLWHQPIFVFTRRKMLSEPSDAAYLGLILLSIILAFFSWKYVERPFRNRDFMTQKRLFKFCGNFIFALICIGMAGVYSFKGNDYRRNPALAHIMSFANTTQKSVYGYGECYIEVNAITKGFAPKCVSSEKDQLFVWGDSHAGALSNGLKKTFNAISQMNLGACPPLLDAGLTAKCNEGNQVILDTIAKVQPKHVLLYANWTAHQNKLDHIKTTLAAIHKKSPEAEVVIVGATPQWSPSLPIILSKADLDLNKAPLYLPNAMKDKLIAADTLLNKAANTQNVRFISASELFCEGDSCLVTLPAKPYPDPVVWDNAHLTDTGALFMAQKIAKNLH